MVLRPRTTPTDQARSREGNGEQKRGGHQSRREAARARARARSAGARPASMPSPYPRGLQNSAKFPECECRGGQRVLAAPLLFVPGAWVPVVRAGLGLSHCLMPLPGTVQKLDRPHAPFPTRGKCLNGTRFHTRQKVVRACTAAVKTQKPLQTLFNNKFSHSKFELFRIVCMATWTRFPHNTAVKSKNHFFRRSRSEFAAGNSDGPATQKPQF